MIAGISHLSLTPQSGPPLSIYNNVAIKAFFNTINQKSENGKEKK